jgi:hypothetical protein
MEAWSATPSGAAAIAPTVAAAMIRKSVAGLSGDSFVSLDPGQTRQVSGQHAKILKVTALAEEYRSRGSMYGAEPHMPASCSSELPRVAYPLVKYRCTNVTAMAPSPTADAHLFTDPCLTSPAANIPGMLVSR